MGNITRKTLEKIAAIPEILRLIAGIDLTHRVPEEHESVDGDEARDYIEGCDNPDNSDYAITAAEIEHHLGPVEDKVVLEVGQGPGNMLEILLEMGARKVIGLDTSPEMTEHCREKFAPYIAEGRMELIQGSIYRNDLPPELVGRVDMVVSENTPHQFHNPQQALEGMTDTLAPGGQGFIRDFRRDNITGLMLFRRAMYTVPIIVPYVLASIGAALRKDEFGEILEGIPEVTSHSEVNAGNPRRLFPELSEVIARDPVPHWKDYAISQIVTFQKYER